MTSVLDLLDRPHMGTLPPRRRATIADRMTAKTRPDDSGCHLWTGHIHKEGYGQISIAQAGYQPVTLGAHRVAYELHRGRIPEGLVIDHLCRVRRCVNPDHLEAVTPRENIMRSPIAPAATNAAKTHCPQGHPYSPENTTLYVRGGSSRAGRLCRTCQRTRKAVTA